MRRLMLSLTLLLLAIGCSDSSGPQGKDPTVLIQNHFTNPTGPITLVWWDQSGQQATFVAASGQNVCAKFTATAATDSVRYMVWVGDTTSTSGSSPWFKTWSPWFDPATGVTADALAYPDGAEYWTAQGTEYPGVVMRTVASPPC